MKKIDVCRPSLGNWNVKANAAAVNEASARRASSSADTHDRMRVFSAELNANHGEAGLLRPEIDVVSSATNEIQHSDGDIRFIGNVDDANLRAAHVPR